MKATPEAKTPRNDFLNTQSSQTRSGAEIVSSVVNQLNERHVTPAIDDFGGHCRFIDHALGLEFHDKAQLAEFFEKSRELFPDAHLDVTAIFESGNRVVAEWILNATHVELLWHGREVRVPTSLRGVSVVAITSGRITEWSDYYDKVTARRSRLSELFTEWMEL